MSRSAILAGIDLAEFAGVTLFSRDGTNVAAPALASLHDGGHYPDAVAVLNGWSAYRPFYSALDAQWSGTGTMTAGIDTDGLFYLQTSGAGALTFTVTPGASDPWGWGGVVVATLDGGAYVAKATRPWTRGVFNAVTDAQFTITAALGVNETVPLYESVVHSLPTWLCGPTAADADEVVECLEKWDNAANDSTSKRIRWGIDAEGRTFCSRPSGIGSAYAITWSSAAFRRLLGFTGSEAEVTSGGVITLTSTYPAAGVLILRNGMAAGVPSRMNDGNAFRLQGGTVAGRLGASWREFEVQAILDGAVGYAPANAAYADEVEQYLHRVAPLLFPGARATILPEWGDPRRGKSLIQQLAEGDAQVKAQSAAIRSDAGGLKGRRRCQVSEDSARRHAASFPGGRPRTQTEPLTWRFVLLDEGGV